MTIESLRMSKTEIMANAGNISVERMIALYEMAVNGSDEYLLGVEYKGKIYGIFTKTLPLEFCSCQTTHGEINNQYLRFRPHKRGSAIIANHPNAICFGTAEEIYPLFKCKNKQGYNMGYSFEIAVYNKYHVEGWKQDNRPASDGGDIELNGRQVQIKFASPDSLATVTSTNKIINCLNRMIAEVA